MNYQEFNYVIIFIALKGDKQLSTYYSECIFYDIGDLK